MVRFAPVTWQLVGFLLPLSVVLFGFCVWVEATDYDPTAVGRPTRGDGLWPLMAVVGLPLTAFQLGMVGWRFLQAVRVVGVLYVKPLGDGEVVVGPPVTVVKGHGVVVPVGAKVSLASDYRGSDKRLRGFNLPFGFDLPTWTLRVNGRIAARWMMPVLTSKTAQANLRAAIEESRAAQVSASAE